MPAAGEGGPSAISLSGVHDGKAWLITDGILGSWGGRATKDGVDGIANPGANLSNMPIELIEARYPLRIESYGLVANSGGAGRRRGGMAITRSYRILGDTAALTVRSDRRAHLPPGLFGGCPGSPSLNILARNGKADLLPVMPMRTLALRKGDLFIHVAPGGGGNGDPLARDPDHVADDVRDGRFTEEFARDVYGVVIGPKGRADQAATKARRDGLAADPSGPAKTQLRLFMERNQSRAAAKADTVGEAA
jgi:N-methylhydantoinase B